MCKSILNTLKLKIKSKFSDEVIEKNIKDE